MSSMKKAAHLDETQHGPAKKQIPNLSEPSNITAVTPSFRFNLEHRLYYLGSGVALATEHIFLSPVFLVSLKKRALCSC